MVKETIKKMEREGISLEIINQALKKDSLEFKLPVHATSNMVVKDIGYFADIHWIRPRGVIIDGDVYPFLMDNTKKIGGNGVAISHLGKVGLSLPTKEQVEKLAANYNQYKAIAQMLGVAYYKKVAYEHPENRNGCVHIYDLEGGQFACTSEETTFFAVKKM